MNQKESWVFVLTPPSMQEGRRPQLWAWNSFEYEPKPATPQVGMIIPGSAHGDLDAPEAQMKIVAVLDSPEAIDFLDRMYQLSKLLGCNDSFTDDIQKFGEHCALAVLKAKQLA